MLNSKRHKCIYSIITITVIITFLWSGFVWADPLHLEVRLVDKLSVPSQVTGLVPAADVFAAGQQAIRDFAKDGLLTKGEFYKKLGEELQKGTIAYLSGTPCLLYSDPEDEEKLAYYVFNPNEPYFSRITTHPEVGDSLWNFLKLNEVEKRAFSDVREFKEKGKSYYQQIFVVTDAEIEFMNTCLKMVVPEWEIRRQVSIPGRVKFAGFGRVKNITPSDAVEKALGNELSKTDPAYKVLDKFIKREYFVSRKLENEKITIRLSGGFGALGARIGNVVYLDKVLVQGYKKIPLELECLARALLDHLTLGYSQGFRKEEQFVGEIIGVIAGISSIRLIKFRGKLDEARSWFENWLGLNGLEPDSVIFGEFLELAENLSPNLGGHREIYSRETIMKIAGLIHRNYPEFKDIQMKDNLWIKAAIEGFKMEDSYRRDSWTHVLREAASEDKGMADEIVDLLAGHLYSYHTGKGICAPGEINDIIETFSAIESPSGVRGLKRALKHPLGIVCEKAFYALAECIEEDQELQEIIITYCSQLGAKATSVGISQIEKFCSYLKNLTKEKPQLVNFEIVEALASVLLNYLESIDEDTITTLGTLSGDYPYGILNTPNIILNTILSLGREAPNIRFTDEWEEVIQKSLMELLSKYVRISQENMVLFNISLKDGGIDEFCALPSKVCVLHDHDDGPIGTSIEERKLPEKLGFRGTMEMSPGDDDGFIRIDIPMEGDSFHSSKSEEAWIGEFIDITKFLAKGIEFRKELVLAKRLKEVFREHGIELPDGKITIGEFINLVRMSAEERKRLVWTKIRTLKEKSRHKINLDEILEFVCWLKNFTKEGTDIVDVGLIIELRDMLISSVKDLWEFDKYVYREQNRLERSFRLRWPEEDKSKEAQKLAGRCSQIFEGIVAVRDSMAVPREIWKRICGDMVLEIINTHVGASKENMALFSVSMDPKESSPVRFSCKPSWFKTYDIHDNDTFPTYTGVGGLIPEGKESLRGTVEDHIGVSTGFVRIDPCNELDPGLLAKQIVDVVSFLVENGANSSKELVLVEGVKSIIGKQLGVSIPDTVTLGEFITLATGGAHPVRKADKLSKTDRGVEQRQAAITKQAAVASPLGIHEGIAKQIAVAARNFPGTKLAVRKSPWGDVVDLTNAAGLLRLHVGPEERVEVIAQGPEAQEALDTIAGLLNTYKDESEEGSCGTQRLDNEQIDLMIGFLLSENAGSDPWTASSYIETLLTVGGERGIRGLKEVLEKGNFTVSENVFYAMAGHIKETRELQEIILSYSSRVVNDNVSPSAYQIKELYKLIKKLASENTDLGSIDIIEAILSVALKYIESIDENRIVTLGTYPGDFPEDIFNVHNLILEAVISLAKQNPQIAGNAKYREIIQKAIFQILSEYTRISREDMTLFMISVEDDNLYEVLAMPSKVFVEHDHDAGLLAQSVESAELPERLIFRGAIVFPLNSSAGFIRVDIPRKKYGSPVEKTEEVLVRELVGVIKYLAEGTNPGKELVLTEEARGILKRGGIELPDGKITIGLFIEKERLKKPEKISLLLGNTPWGAKLLYPNIPDRWRYGGKDFSVQPRWVPESIKGRRQVIGEEELLRLVLNPGWKVVITRNYNEMTYASLYIITKLMEMAESEICFGLATGGTTESLRKAIGLVSLSRQILDGLYVPGDKVRLWQTLDNYYWPEGSDPRTVAIASYFQEQNYMLLENLYREKAGPDYFIAPPDVTGMSLEETALDFYRRMNVFLDDANKILVQLHGIGSSGHDAFNEVFLRLKRAGQRIVTDLRRYVSIPEFEEMPSFYNEMGLLRPDHGTVVLDITRVQNIGHIIERSFHPFFLRFMADNILLDIEELLVRLSTMRVEEIATYYSETKYRFKSEEEFVKELQYLMDNYRLTPRWAVTQGTGDTALRTGYYDSVNMFMVCSPHKQEPFRRAIELRPGPSCTASVLQLAANAVVIATADSALTVDWSKCFLFEPRNKEGASLCTEENIEARWGETGPARRINAVLGGTEDVEPQEVFREESEKDEGYEDLSRLIENRQHGSELGNTETVAEDHIELLIKFSSETSTVYDKEGNPYQVKIDYKVRDNRKSFYDDLAIELYDEQGKEIGNLWVWIFEDSRKAGIAISLMRIDILNEDYRGKGLSSALLRVLHDVCPPDVRLKTTFIEEPNTLTVIEKEGMEEAEQNSLFARMFKSAGFRDIGIFEEEDSYGYPRGYTLTARTSGFRKVTRKVIDPIGIHAKSAVKIVQVAQRYPDTEIYIEVGGRRASARKRASLLRLGVGAKEIVDIIVRGKGAEKLLGELRALSDLFQFGEEVDITAEEGAGAVRDGGDVLDDRALFGGKAANLRKLKSISGMKVPEGFEITTESYNQFIEDNNIGLLIEKLRGQIEGGEDTREQLEKIREAIANAEVPQNIRDEIVRDCLRVFGDIDKEEISLIVRSSEVSEDTEDTSSAGQYETLSAKTREELFRAIKRCWASLYTEMAFMYRRRFGIDEKGLNMGLIVQRKIEPRYYGVVTNLMIEGKEYYLFEFVDVQRHDTDAVSGEVTPGYFLLTADGKIKPEFLHSDSDCVLGLFYEEIYCEYLSQIKAEIGFEKFQMEFVIDKHNDKYVLQVRPAKRASFSSITNFDRPLTNIEDLKIFPASPGQAQGRVVYVTNEKDLPLKDEPPYILLTEFADNNTCHLLLSGLDRGNLVGVITTVGGYNTHFATVAREADVPYMIMLYRDSDERDRRVKKLLGSHHVYMNADQGVIKYIDKEKQPSTVFNETKAFLLKNRFREEELEGVSTIQGLIDRVIDICQKCEREIGVYSDWRRSFTINVLNYLSGFVTEEQKIREILILILKPLKISKSGYRIGKEIFYVVCRILDENQDRFPGLLDSFLIQEISDVYVKMCRNEWYMEKGVGIAGGFTTDVDKAFPYAVRSSTSYIWRRVVSWNKRNPGVVDMDKFREVKINEFFKILNDTMDVSEDGTVLFNIVMDEDDIVGYDVIPSKFKVYLIHDQGTQVESADADSSKIKALTGVRGTLSVEGDSFLRLDFSGEKDEDSLLADILNITGLLTDGLDGSTEVILTEKVREVLGKYGISLSKKIRLNELYGEMQRIASAFVGPQGPVGKKAAGGYEELWEAGLVDSELREGAPVGIGEGHPRYGKIDIDLLKKKLSDLVSVFGPGILAVIDAVRIVDNIGVKALQDGADEIVPYAMMAKEGGRNVLLLDVDAFDNEGILYIVLEHELKESIMTVIPCENDAVRELTTNFMSLKLALERGIRFDKSQLERLGADLQFFEALEVLQAMAEVTDRDIIAVAIEHMRGMPYYRDLFHQFGFAGSWEAKVMTAQDRYRAAIDVFNDIMEAKVGVNKAEREKLQKELKETVEEVEINVSVVKTFTGKQRVIGLEGLPKVLQCMIGVTAKQIHSVDRLAGQVTKATDTKYILIDRGRLEELKAVIGEDAYRRVEKTLRDNKYQICTEMPDGVALGNVIRLVDPVDLENMPKVGGMLYLPMPYTRSSLYMAANIVQAGGVVGDIDSLVTSFVRDLYSRIIGEDVSDSDLVKLFTMPWEFLPAIRKVIDDLNRLRTAAIQIEKAA